MMGTVIYTLVIHKSIMKTESSHTGININSTMGIKIHTAILPFPNNDICLVFPFMGLHHGNYIIPMLVHNNGKKNIYIYIYIYI